MRSACRRLGWTVCLLASGAATAGDRTMWVNETSLSGSPANPGCGASIEGALRDLGFQTAEPEERGRPALRAVVTGRCRYVFHRAGARGGSCHAEVDLLVAGFGHRTLRADRDHESSVDVARSEVCRDLVQQVRQAVGAPRLGRSAAAEEHPRPAAGSPFLVALDWQGELQPMPLLKVTSFLQKSGYAYELVEGGESGCRLKVTLDEPVERFSELLETFLGAHYRLTKIEAGRSELRLHLASQSPGG